MLVLVLLTVRIILLPALGESNFGLIIDRGGNMRIQDFAGNLTFAKAFWAGEAGYDVQSHLDATGRWRGGPVSRAMPFNYSPTMLLVLGPFCLLSNAWSFALWSFLSLALIWGMTRPPWAMWLTAGVFAPAGFACLAVGQTTFLTAAAMLFLMERDVASGSCEQGTENGRRQWSEAVVLWLLTAKPPVALTAGFGLIATRRWRPVVLASGLTLLSAALLTPRLGSHWVLDYVRLMAQSNVQTGDPAFVWSLAPETMSNLRGLLYTATAIGDAAASRYATAVWMLAITAILALAIRRRIPVQAAWALLVLAYLLFCPHVSSTGDLHLLLVLALLLHPSQSVPPALRWSGIGLALATLYLIPTVGVYGGPARAVLAVGGKVALCGLVLALWLRRSLAPIVSQEVAE
jgi:hypothetical protein